MSTRAPITELGTHEVINQPPVLTDYNPFDADPALKEALRREGAGWADAEALDRVLAPPLAPA